MFLKRCLSALLILVLVLGAVPALAAYDKPYYIDVDLTNQIVTVYNTSDGSIARQSLCSSGAAGHETIKGTFYLPAKDRDDERSEWYSFFTLDVYAKWATRIEGPYLFHSIPCYSKNLDDVVPRYVKQFGIPDSHGCVRLRVEDAYFIAKNCLRGTRVRIFESGELDEDLRQLLYVSSYSQEEMSYQEFLGISDDALGRGSSGSEVFDLQHRMSELGYYDGEPNGAYDNDMITAVKQLQNDLGVADSGIASQSLLEVIYSDDAPVAAGLTTLEEGKSGPVVKKLQLALQTLGVYQGEIDSVLDLEVTEAVKKFQSACNYPINGVLTAEMQQAIYYQAEKLKETFGADSVPAVELIAEELWMGTIDAKANIIIRSRPDTKSENLGKVLIGETVSVIKLEGDWANIVADGISGYIYKKYLTNPQTDYKYSLLYTGADGTTYRIGHTIEEYMQGAQSFASEFSDIYASEKFNSELDEKVDYITVNTGSDDVSLNLRADAGPEGEILAEVPNGTDLRVLSTEGEWTRVGYNDHIGYLMNQYLTFWEGSIEDAEETYVTLDSIDNVHEVLAGMKEKAVAYVVVPVDEKGKTIKPRLYEEPNKKADKLTTMAEGAEVEIVEFISGSDDDNWVKINYLGQTGYMQDVCLRFAFEGA